MMQPNPYEYIQKLHRDISRLESRCWDLEDELSDVRAASRPTKELNDVIQRLQTIQSKL